MRNFLDWLQTCESKKIPDDAIKIHLPKVNQTTNYTCGAACLRAVAGYFGVGPEDEDEFAELLNSTPEDGTSPGNIIRGARQLGLHAFGRHNMTIDSLKSRIDKGIPVICSVQAWGNEKVYPKDGSGHYVTAIGFDNERIYFEDPSIAKSRGFLSYNEFMTRWHDKESKDKRYERFGIAVWRNALPKDISKKDKAKVIESVEIK
jgi:predicted double-glycine peptidase